MEQTVRWIFLLIAVGVFGAGGAAAQPEPLVYFAFDAEMDGRLAPETELVDNSSYAHPASVVGRGLSWTPDGKKGGALAIDAAGGYLRVPRLAQHIEDARDVTVTAWYRVEYMSDGGTLVTSTARDTGKARWALHLDADTRAHPSALRAQLGTASTQSSAKSRTAPPRAEWQHVALVVEDGERLRLYTDCELSEQTFLDRPVGRTAEADAHGLLAMDALSIGTRPSEERTAWTGRIDEVHVFDAALTEDDLAALCQEPVPPVTMEDIRVEADEQEAVIEWITRGGDGDLTFEVQHRTPQGRWMPTADVRGLGSMEETRVHAYRADELAAGTHTFRVQYTRPDGSVVFSPEKSVEIEEAVQPASLEVFPNPVRNDATVLISVPEAQHVSVVLFDLLGRRIETLYEGTVTPGAEQRITFQRRDLISGVYLLRARGETFSTARRIAIVQ